MVGIGKTGSFLFERNLRFSHVSGQYSNLFETQVHGRCGSVHVRLIPAPRGTGIVSAPVPKKLLSMAGLEDCYTSASGQTSTLGNFGKKLSY